MMTTYESIRHPGTFIHANSEDIDPKTKTVIYLDADGKNKSMSIATLKRWYKAVDDWDAAMEREAEEQPAELEETEVFETEETSKVETVEAPAEQTAEEQPAEVAEEPKAKKNMARKPKSLKLTELTFNGETKSIRDWAKELNLPYPTLYDRINRNGWSVEEAIRCPLGMSRKEFRESA